MVLSAISIITTITFVIITFLLTFFLTSISQKRKFTKESEKLMDKHNSLIHENKTVKESIENHQKNCTVKQDIKNMNKHLARMNTCLQWLVRQQGGDPNEFKLID